MEVQKKRLSAESAIIIICIVGLLLTGGLLYFTKSSGNRDLNEAESLGFVKPLGRDVRVRGASDSNWNSVPRDVNVFRNDRVFTGTTSSAEVRLKNKQTFTVEPNSLIRITDENDRTLLGLEDGGFLGELKKGAKYFVESNGKVTEIESDGAVLRMNSENGRLKLEILEGSAKVQGSDKKVGAVEVHANEQADLSTGKAKITRFDVTLVEPRPSAILWDRKEKTKFVWKKSGENPKPLAIEIAEDANFKKPLLVSQVGEDTVNIGLPPGRIYFWRLADVDDHTARSTAYNFNLARMEAPKVTKDAQVQVTTDAQGFATTPMEFRWVDPSLSESYEFQVAKDPEFSQLVKVESTEQDHVVLNKMTPGEYYWKVSSKHSKREDLTSIVAHLSLTTSTPRALASETPTPTTLPAVAVPTTTTLPENKPLEAPSLALKELDFELFEEGLEPDLLAPGFVRVDKPNFTWSAVVGAENYDVEIAIQDDFKKIIAHDTTAVTGFRWENPQVGQFQVRVVAHKGAEKTVSGASRMRTMLPPPTFTGLNVDSEMEKGAVLHASVRKHTLASLIETQVSGDELFVNPEKIKGPDTVVHLDLTEPGVKYVRSRFLNAGGWPISRFSKVQTVEALSWLPSENVLAQRLAAEKEAAAKAEAARIREQERSEARRRDRVEMRERTQTYLPFPKYNVWGGIGGNYIVFDQSSALLGSGSYNQFTIPVLAAGGGFRVNERSFAEFEYHDRPSTISVGQNISIDSTAYHWRTVIGEYQYRFGAGDYGIYSLIPGFQIHQVPFLNLNKNGSVSLTQNQLQNLSLGLKYNYLTQSNLDYEIFMRYQTMLGSSSLSGDSFHATPLLMFDGSLGLSRHYESGLTMGLYWFGQQNNFRYDSVRNGTSTSGTQTMFNSTLQFRLGYDFFGLGLVPMFRRRRKGDDDAGDGNESGADKS